MIHYSEREESSEEEGSEWHSMRDAWALAYLKPLLLTHTASPPNAQVKVMTRWLCFLETEVLLVWALRRVRNADILVPHPSRSTKNFNRLSAS